MGAAIHIVHNNFPGIRRALPKIVDAVAHYYIDLVYSLSQDLVPVDTGDLKASGRVQSVSGGYKLIYDAKNSSGISYAGFVEYGTSRTRAQPYLTPAAEAALGMLAKNLNVEGLIAEMM